VLDPCHGGKQPGAVAGNYKESAICRAILSPLVDSILRDRKEFDVQTSFGLLNKPINSTWLPNARRADLSNYTLNVQPIDFLLSIHLNAGDPSAKGMMVCYRTEANLQSADYFYSAAIAYAESAGFDLAGNRDEKLQARPSDLAILKVAPNSLLVEAAFLTNAGDRQLLLLRPDLYADAIKAGIYAVMNSL